MEIPRGRVVSKDQFFKGKYDGKADGGFKLKNLLWEGYGYFLEQHNYFPKNCSALSVASGSGALASHMWVPLW